MTVSDAEQADALDPVRTELLRAAHESADAVLAQAGSDAEATLRKARAEAAVILDEARRQGEADGTSAAEDERTRARRDAWALELAARSEVYAELRRRVSEGVRQAPMDRRVLRARLEARARALLGPDAMVTASPDGGVTAVAPGRRTDLTLTRLADRALDRLGMEAESLWAL
jgi:vacuolar-type H+-ATPase subunit E/Vma4